MTSREWFLISLFRRCVWSKNLRNDPKMVNMTQKSRLEVVWTDFDPPGAEGAEEKFSRFFGDVTGFGSEIPTTGGSLRDVP